MFPYQLAPLESLWLERNRTRVLVISGMVTVLIAAVDWWTTLYVSMGFLYLFPIIFAAGFLPRWTITVVGIACALVSEAFSSLEPSSARFMLTAIAVAGCGLFVCEVASSRRRNLEFQAQLKALVETSPVPIVSIDRSGLVQLANRAATDLLQPPVDRLAGYPIAAFLPDLHHALPPDGHSHRWDSRVCRGQRGDGRAFRALVWYASFKEGRASSVAAVITDARSEPDSPPAVDPMETTPSKTALRWAAPANARETEVLQLLLQGLTNKQIAVSMKTSESTVKNSLHQLFAKAGVRTRTQLVRAALDAQTANRSL